MSSPFDYYFPKLNVDIDSTKKLSDYIIRSPEHKYFEDLRYFDVEISDNLAGFLIGKNGRNINRLRKKFSKSKIIISNENGKRYVYISNSVDTFKVIGYLIKANHD